MAQRNSREKRRLFMSVVAIVLVAILVLAVVLSALPRAYGVSRSDVTALQSQASDLAAEKQRIQNQINALSGNKAKALAQKEALDEQIAIIEKQIANTQAQIDTYNQLIAEETVKLEEAQAKEQQQYEALCTRVRSMEEMGSASYLAVLFGATSFADLISRANYIYEIAEYDNALQEQLTATREQIEDTKAYLEECHAELTAQEEQLAASKAELDAQVAAAQQLVAQIENETAEYERARQQIEAEEAAVGQQIDNMLAQIAAEEAAARRAAEEAAQRAQQQASARAQQEAAAAADRARAAAAAANINSESVYKWPLNGYYSISSNFGYRTHPVTGAAYSFHGGIDIPAPKNTPIMASRSGVVLISGYNGSYGNYVAINHGNNQVTLYAHMNSRAVSVGETVSQGQVIGYVGTTGSSTGYHLHFEVRINGSQVNPLSFF